MPRNAICFKRHDNQAKVIINGAVVWDSGVVHHNPSVNSLVNLDKYMPSSGSIKVTVELHNAKADAHSYNPAEIEYVLEKNGEPHGTVKVFIDDKSSIKDNSGLVWSNDHSFPL